jgi:hypothetical protein
MGDNEEKKLNQILRWKRHWVSLHTEGKLECILIEG